MNSFESPLVQRVAALEEKVTSLSEITGGLQAQEIFLSGDFNPNGVLSAVQGTIYQRIGASPGLYFNSSLAGTPPEGTTWTVINTGFPGPPTYDGATNHNTVLMSGPAGQIVMDSYRMPDGGWIGNLGGAYLGFDSSGVFDYAYFMDCKVGIGELAPSVALHIKTAVASEKIRLEAGVATADNWISSYDELNQIMWILVLGDRSDSDCLAIYDDQVVGAEVFKIYMGGNVHIEVGDLYLPSAKGIIHADSVIDGNFLRADGTRYIPADFYLAGTAGETYTFPVAGGNIVTGNGVANRVVYWSGATTLTSDSGLTYNDATDSLTTGNFFTTDGGTFGISGNELLTVNAAGTFAFSGISGVTVEDGDYIGISGDVRILYDASNGRIDNILGDAAGDDEWRLVDSGGTAVVTADSDGNTEVAGDFRLAIGKGIIHADSVAAGNFLRADGTRYIPAGFYLDGTAGETYTFPAAGGSIVTGNGVANRVAYWSGATTLTSDAGMTYNAATDSLTAGDFFTTDGGQFGISGNELLTVNAAGTFAFSGISGVTVEDEDWIGNSAASARLGFDSSGGTDYAYFEDCNVGIGTTSPSGELEIYNAGFIQSIINRDNDLNSAGMGELVFQAKGTNLASIRGISEGTGEDSGALAFLTKATAGTYDNKMYIDPDGNVGIGTTSPDYKLDVDGVIGVSDNAGDPSTVANKATFYGKDVGGTVEAFAQDEAGNAAQLTAHPTGDDMPFTTEPWEHIASYSNAYLGVRRYFRIEKALRDIEALTGEQYIYDAEIPRRDWYMDQARQRKRKPMPRWMKDFINSRGAI